MPQSAASKSEKTSAQILTKIVGHVQQIWVMCTQTRPISSTKTGQYWCHADPSTVPTNPTAPWFLRKITFSKSNKLLTGNLALTLGLRQQQRMRQQLQQRRLPV